MLEQSTFFERFCMFGKLYSQYKIVLVLKTNRKSSYFHLLKIQYFKDE